MGESENRLGTADWCVFAGSLGAWVAIGFYHGWRKKKKEASTDEILLGEGKLPIIPTALSMVASFMSAISLVGYPAEIYYYGTMFCYYCLTYLIAFPLAAFVFVPLLYDLNITSAYEYLQRRFGRSVRVLAAVVFCCQMILYMAVVLYAPALTLGSVSSLPVSWAIVLSGVIVTLYTMMGGAKTVVWTSAAQMVLIFAGLLCICIKGSLDLGGFSVVIRRAIEGARLQYSETGIDPTIRHSVWSLVIGGTFTLLSLFATNQLIVQRYISMPTLLNAKIVMLCNMPINWFLLLLYTICGLILYATYHKCDPQSADEIQKPDQLLPYFALHNFKALPAFTGMFIAAVYSAGLSTMSTGTNALAAVLLEDFIRPLAAFFAFSLSETRLACVTKLLEAAVGFVCMSIALLFSLTDASTLLQAALSIFGMAGGPVLGLFILGMFFPWANTKGALVGGSTSLIMCVWLAFGGLLCGSSSPWLSMSTQDCQVTRFNLSLNETSTNQTITESCNIPTSLTKFYSISYQYYSLFGVIIVLVLGLIVSLLTGLQDPKLINPALFAGCIRRFFSNSNFEASGKSEEEMVYIRI